MRTKEFGEVVELFEQENSNTSEISWCCVVRFNHKPNLKLGVIVLNRGNDE